MVSSLSLGPSVEFNRSYCIFAFFINKDKFPYYVVISIPLHLIPGGLRFNASLTHPNNSGAKNTF
jgi:hypothetical protein